MMKVRRVVICLYPLHKSLYQLGLLHHGYPQVSLPYRRCSSRVFNFT
ncbi:hypothetical protein Hanom_Chr07g00649951 [Helianthus anomalus]